MIKYPGHTEYLLTSKVNNAHTIILFKKAVYLYVLISGIITLPDASQLWGPEAYNIRISPGDDLLFNVMNILSRPRINNYYIYFIYGQLACCILLLSGLMRRTAAISLYLITANLYYSARLAQNAGDNVVLLMLFYMIFMNEYPEQIKNNISRTIGIATTNFAFLAAQIQVCILYLVSAVYKLNGPHWTDGSALYYILNIDDYSSNWIQHHIANRDWITIPATYLIMAFQFTFPLTVWIKKLKPFTLTLGIVFHLLVIFIIGLTDFGIIMIIMYLLFLSNEKSERILTKLKFL